MFPDSTFPLHIGEFFEAVEGQSSDIAFGYLRALTHYWKHTHCDGLRDDSEFLRRLCRIDADKWQDACAIIFDNDKFFTLGEDLKWHQKRAKEEWIAACDKYNRLSRGGKMTAERRWGKK